MTDAPVLTSLAPTPAEHRGLDDTPDLGVRAMYERLIAALRRATCALAERDEASLKHELDAAASTVFELLGTLNFRAGGELAPRLAALYGYFASEILVMGHLADQASLDRLIEMAEILNGSHAATATS